MFGVVLTQSIGGAWKKVGCMNHGRQPRLRLHADGRHQIEPKQRKVG